MNKKNKKLPLVCIIIVNWNGGKVMIDCLKSLKKTSYKNYKVIVVDNGSTDKKGVQQLKKINKKIEIIYLDKNYGYTIGVNMGYKYALEKYSPNYICEMNNDIVTVQKDWLGIQINELEKNKEYGISSGKLIFPDGRVQVGISSGKLTFQDGKVQAFNQQNEKGYFEQDRGQYDFIREVPFVRGGCLIVKKEVVDKIGHHDENFFYGPNDIDYCYRAWKNGFKVVYNGFSKSIHLAGQSGFSHEKDWIFLPQTEGMLIFYLRYKGLMPGLWISLRFLGRAFVTRKTPFKPKKLSNLTFHKTSLKRMFLFFRALTNALKNYKKVKQDSEVKIIKIT